MLCLSNCNLSKFPVILIDLEMSFVHPESCSRAIVLKNVAYVVH